jgi:hypothetical protein
MRRVHRLAATALATVGVLAGGLVFAGTPAFAELGHRLLSQITEVPAEPGAVNSGPLSEIFAMTLNPNGNVYAYDRDEGGGLIDEFNSTGGFVSQFEDGADPVTDAGAGAARDIAVNEATGEVYLPANPANFEREKYLNGMYVFSASGNFLRFWNGEHTPCGQISVDDPIAVDNSTDAADPDKGDVYASAGEGALDVFEADGEEKCLFQLSASFGHITLGTVDQANGDLYVDVESGGTDVLEPEPGGEYKLLQHYAGFDAEAVNDTDGDMYARGGGGLEEFNSAGVKIGELMGTTAGPLQEPVPFRGVHALALAPNGDVYVADGKRFKGETQGAAVDIFGPNIVFPDVATAGFPLPSVQQTSATVEGTVNPEAIAGGTTYFFQYGTSTAFGSSTPVQSAGEGASDVPVSATLSGLREDTTYYYRLVVEAEGEHHFGAIHNVTTLPAGPVTYSVTSKSATVEGTVDTQDLPTSYWVEYGSSVAYGQLTPEKSVAGSLEGVPIAQIVSELLPSSTYHYRLASSNALGTSYSSDQTATTGAFTPPTVSTGGASGISQNSATLSGTISTNSLQTSYGFEISTEPDNYGPATGLGAIGGSLTEEVSVMLGELQPGTTYYYRVTATNADGTSHGEPESFATPSFPTLITASASLPLIATPAIAFPTGSLENTSTNTKTRTLTDAQRLNKALKACGQDEKQSRRTACVRQAHKRYGPANKKAKKGAHKKK